MKIGAVYPQTELRGDPRAVVRIGAAVETLGLDYLLAYDHVLGVRTIVSQSSPGLTRIRIPSTIRS
jgi:hypothetical protein